LQAGAERQKLSGPPEDAAMAEDQVRLEVEAERATLQLQQRAEDAYLPLPVAAAITFHQAHGGAKAIVTLADYQDALSIAAAALSRLVPIYTLQHPAEGRVALKVDLTKAHFARGATQLRNGEEAIGELSVARKDLVSALALIKRTGLPFTFAGTKDR
jgi:hypothetical protein